LDSKALHARQTLIVEVFPAAVAVQAMVSANLQICACLVRKVLLARTILNVEIWQAVANALPPASVRQESVWLVRRVRLVKRSLTVQACQTVAIALCLASVKELSNAFKANRALLANLTQTVLAFLAVAGAHLTVSVMLGLVRLVRKALLASLTRTVRIWLAVGNALPRASVRP
jgi:hypothetical protein